MEFEKFKKWVQEKVDEAGVSGVVFESDEGTHKAHCDGVTFTVNESSDHIGVTWGALGIGMHKKKHSARVDTSGVDK